MAVILPKLSSRGPIANEDGSPSTDFVLFQNKLIEAIEQNLGDLAAVQAEIQATQQQILNILNGDEPFTALNVNGATVATLGSAAEANIGTGAGEVASADDPRITDALNTSTGGTVTGAVEFADDVDFSGANVRLGAVTATADLAITSYITILDDTGTPRKLAVIP